MHLAKLFDFGAPAERKAPPQDTSDVLRLATAERFLTEARGCLNENTGREFVAGVRAAFMPIADAVARATGKSLSYGDVLQQYARLTRGNAVSVLGCVINLATGLKPAPAAGVRFVAAQLILAYGLRGIALQGALPDLMRLQCEAIEILEAGSKYG